MSEAPLPPGYSIINKQTQKSLQATNYNPRSPASDEDAFNDELIEAIDLLKEYFSTRGTYGSYERYLKRLSSDWDISDDGYSDSRGIGVDILNPKLLSQKTITDVQRELRKLPNDWIIFLFHDNEYNDKGEYTGEEGFYCVWITKDTVRIYSEREEDIAGLLQSIQSDKTSDRGRGTPD